jgi:hypothetical protein
VPTDRVRPQVLLRPSESKMQAMESASCFQES